MLRKKMALTFVVLFFVFALPVKAQSQKDWDWVNKHFYDVLNQLMPLDNHSLSSRSYRDLHTDELEYLFYFDGHTISENLVATLRIADKTSIHDQIMALHRKKPTATISEIKAKLKIKEWQFSESSCPAIKTQFDQFFRLSLEMMPAKERADREAGKVTITLHPRIYCFKAQVAGGDLNFTTTFEDHPFAIWAAETFKALNTCANKTTPTKK